MVPDKRKQVLSWPQWLKVQCYSNSSKNNQYVHFYGQLIVIGQDLYSKVQLRLSISNCSWCIMHTKFINSLFGIRITMIGAYAHKCILAEQLHYIPSQVQQISSSHTAQPTKSRYKNRKLGFIQDEEAELGFTEKVYIVYINMIQTLAYISMCDIGVSHIGRSKTSVGTPGISVSDW